MPVGLAAANKVLITAAACYNLKKWMKFIITKAKSNAMAIAKTTQKAIVNFLKNFLSIILSQLQTSCFKKSHVIRAVCEDYRAGISVDLEHDQKNKKEGQRIKCPLLVLWASNGFASDFGDPLTIWKNWAEHVKGHEVKSTHFLMEEATDEIQHAFHRFFF